MSKPFTRSSLLLFAAALAGCAVVMKVTAQDGADARAAQNQTSGASRAEQNPLLAEWTGPYGGVPPFDRVKVSDFKPALEAAMSENLSEVERIANDQRKRNLSFEYLANRLAHARRL